MTNEQQSIIERGKELVAAEQQLSIALGLDHDELLQRAALQRMFNAEPGLARKASRQVRQNAWLQRLALILPELASRVESLNPIPRCEYDEGQSSHPCSLCISTSHYGCWDSVEDSQVEAECQAIAEKLAELLAAVPGPIETVDVSPLRLDSNLAEVTVKRNHAVGEGLVDG